MNDKDLIEQYRRCKKWNDPEQWEALAVFYWQSGYKLNAKHCLEKADSARIKTTAVAPLQLSPV